MAINQTQVEKEGLYEAKSPLAAILADLEQIAGLAAVAAARQKRKRRMGGWILLGGLIGSIAGAAMGVPLLVGLSLIAMIVGLFIWIGSFFGGGKLTDHGARLDTLKQRIAMIQQDAAAQTPFTVRLALSSTPRQLSQGAWHGRKNGNQQLSEEGWLSLEGKLLDGTVLTDEIKDLTRTRTYSSASGKRKSKTRKTHLVNVRFTYPSELYGDARPAEKALHGEVKVAPSAALRSVRVTEKAIAMKAIVTVEKEIIMTAGMLSVGGYRILNLARKLASGQQGKTK